MHRVRKTSVWIRSARHLHHASLGHLAICAATNRHPVGLPKLGRPRPTAAAAAPATFRLAHVQIVGREQMAIAADIGYGHGLEDSFQRKAHHISFGCSKARPRYHLQRLAPSCIRLHGGPPSSQRCPVVAWCPPSPLAQASAQGHRRQSDDQIRDEPANRAAILSFHGSVGGKGRANLPSSL